VPQGFHRLFSHGRCTFLNAPSPRIETGIAAGDDAVTWNVPVPDAIGVPVPGA